MAGDACVVESQTEIQKLEENLLLQQQQQQQPCGSLSSVLKQDEPKESSFFLSFPKESQEDVHHNPSSIAFKRVRCSSQTDRRIRENQEVGLEKDGGVLDSMRGQRVDLGNSVAGSYKCDQMELFSLPVTKVEVFDVNKVKMAAEEGAVNGVPAALLDIDSMFKETSRVENAGGEGILGCLKGIDDSARSSLKIEVIDDTALVLPLPLPKTGYAGANIQQRYRKKNERQETDRKQAMQPRRKGKGMKKSLDTSERQKTVTQVGETRNKTAKLIRKAHNGCRENGDGIRRKYPIEELEALRFVDVVEQRKVWRDIYNGLGNGVVVEYEDLAITKHQKNIRLNYDPMRRIIGRKEGGPGIIGVVAGRGRWSHLNIAVH